MKNKRKSIVDTYDPLIYPIQLVVVKNTTVEQLNKLFSTCTGEDVTDEYLGDQYCCITFAGIRRSDNAKCIVVYENIEIDKKDYNALRFATHEAGHYVMDMFLHIGASSPYEDQEPFCYLLEWAAEKIYLTLTKKNDGNKRKKQKAVR